MNCSGSNIDINYLDRLLTDFNREYNDLQSKLVNEPAPRDKSFDKKYAERTRIITNIITNLIRLRTILLKINNI